MFVLLVRMGIVLMFLFRSCGDSTKPGASGVPIEYEILWESAGDIATRVYCLMNDDEALWAGTYNGLYRSADSGRTWYSVHEGLNLSTWRAMVKKDGRIFAAGGILEGGVAVSADRGATWHDASNGLVNTSVSSLAVNGKYLFAGTFAYGVFVSEDNGANWRSVNRGLPATIGDVTALASEGSVVMALINSDTSGFFISEDFGSTWRNESDGLPPDHADFTSIVSTDMGLLLSADGDSGGVYLKPKGTNRWSRLPLSDRSVSVLAASGPVIFAGGFGGLMASTDHGRTWLAADNGLYPQGLPDVNTILRTRDELWAGLNFGGVYKLPIPQSISH